MKHRYTGDYSSTVYTLLAGAVSMVLETGHSRVDTAKVLEQHANRLRHDSDEEVEQLTISRADNSLDHINWSVVDAEGEEYLLTTLDGVHDLIEEELGGGD